ncbi:MAG: endonuclease/exonuclease/phosphatase family protein [Flammeovirgaceae bacterium]|nr:endonuclease/exonuclease/phosphatase family protein [Flammeovirgaceae bacterium]
MKISFLVLLSFFSMVSLAQSVSVMSYNIRLDTEADGINQWKNRSEKVVSLIKKYNPDLLGVQEALHNQMMDLQKGLPDYAFIGGGRDDGKEKGEYSAIFYKKDKFEVIKEKTLWLSETPEVPGSKSWDAAITRVVTFAVLKDKASGKSFIYANTHFDHIGKEARKNSASLIKIYLKGFITGATFEKTEKEIPVLVSGDCNSEPTDEPYLTMINGKDITLFDARPAKNLTGTFCGFEVGKMECLTIDYIFYSTPWKASNYKAIQDHDGKYYPSDHLPVMATFTLK